MARTIANRMAAKSNVAARNKVLAQMNDALRAVAQELTGRLVDKIVDNLRFYHGVGHSYLDVKRRPDRYLTEQQRLQGVDPTVLLEQVMSTSKETLRKAAAFAEKYDKDDLVRLFAYRNSDDTKFRLHWGHVVYLLGVNDARQRIKFEEQAVAEMWNADELHKQIMKHYNGPRRAGGRPLGIPKTVPAGIGQVKNISTLWLKRSNEVWDGQKHSVFNSIMSLPVDKITPAMVKDVQGMKLVLEQTSQRANELLARCQSVLEYVEGVAEPAEPAPTVNYPVVSPTRTDRDRAHALVARVGKQGG